MPRGGKRPGAGRPRGSTNKTRFELPEQGEQYRNAVMNDPAADWRRRDRMAKAAAPYCHAKITYDAKGKKQAAEAVAQTAG
jgi:phage terminase small subunit